MAVGVLHRVREGNSRINAANLEEGLGDVAKVDEKIGREVELAPVGSKDRIVSERGDAEISENSCPRGRSPVRHRPLSHENSSELDSHEQSFHSVDLSDEGQKSPARSGGVAHQRKRPPQNAASGAAEGEVGTDVELGVTEKRERGGVVYGRLQNQGSVLDRGGRVKESRSDKTMPSVEGKEPVEESNEGISKEVLNYCKGVRRRSDADSIHFWTELVELVRMRICLPLNSCLKPLALDAAKESGEWVSRVFDELGFSKATGKYGERSSTPSKMSWQMYQMQGSRCPVLLSSDPQAQKSRIDIIESYYVNRRPFDWLKRSFCLEPLPWSADGRAQNSKRYQYLAATHRSRFAFFRLFWRLRLHRRSEVWLP